MWLIMWWGDNIQGPTNKSLSEYALNYRLVSLLCYILRYILFKDSASFNHPKHLLKISLFLDHIYNRLAYEMPLNSYTGYAWSFITFTIAPLPTNHHNSSKGSPSLRLYCQHLLSSILLFLLIRCHCTNLNSGFKS